MKIIGKVIEDNGYKIEIIRPIKDAMLSIGQKVEITIVKEQVDLVNLFDNLIDSETQDMILDKFNTAKKEIETPNLMSAVGAKVGVKVTGATKKK